MRFPNPIGKRLEFVRKQYAGRPEVYETTAQIVAKTLGKGPAEIDPKATVAWEKHIPWLAKHVNVLEKKKERGIPVTPEMRRLESGFRQSIEPFLKPRSGKKGARRVELAKLSPKQARKHYARTALTTYEKKQAQAAEAGYRQVKNLGNGYIAVVGSPNLKARLGHLGGVALHLIEARREIREWIEENAKFQQWLGVTMKNCLQFYRVNYVPYGEQKFDVQRKGGKLYAILDPKGKPVVAILTNAKGQVIETNGPDNQPPPESAMPYLEKLEKAMGWPKGAGGAFVAPPNFDPALRYAIEAISDSDFFTTNLRARRSFIRKAQGYARQAGADFSQVWPRFAVYFLETSKYSVLNTAKRNVGYPNIRPTIDAIRRVVRCHKSNASPSDFMAARVALRRIIKAANKIMDTTESGVESDAAGNAYVTASSAFFSAHSAEASWSWQTAEAVADAEGAPGNLAANELRRAAFELSQDEPYSEKRDEKIEKKADARGREIAGAAIQDFARKFLELMREAAQQAGRNLAANPKRRKAGKRKVVKKKTVRKTTPEWQRLIRRCQKLWDHYCERPGKTRLKDVLKHLEKMKASTSAKVATERRRCLRAANLEAKRLKLK